MAFYRRALHVISPLLCVVLLSGCAETQLLSHWAKKAWPGQAETKGNYKVGTPYKVENVQYYPQENFTLSETGIASWYGPGFHHKKTANGEKYDQHELTAAHRTLQLPSLVRVTNLENGRSVVVRVNDRGPFKRGRIMDVSQRAAELLDFINKGTARVRIDVLENESRMLAEAARRGEDTRGKTAEDFRGPKMAQAEIPPMDEMPAVYANNDDDTPESLRTPTITVEALEAPAGMGTPRRAAPLPTPPQTTKLTEGRIQNGHFMPDPVVSTVPVTPTGIFVQAGSFSVYENAERLTKKLVNIAPTVIEPITINSRKMYRVKLGPIATVEAADIVLAKVVNAGMGAAKVIKVKKT